MLLYGGVKFVSQTYDMRCRKLPLKSPGIIHLSRGIITELEKALRNKLTQCWFKYVLQLLVKASKYHNKSNSFQCKLRGAYICEPVTVGAYIKVFLYFVASNCLCRFSSGLTDVHMDTSTKLATFSLEEEVLTESNMSNFVAITYISLRQDYIFI